MSTPTIEAEPAAEQPPAVERAPLRELLPTGSLRLVVVAASLAAIVGSFVRFGLDGRAFVGAVFCPVLIVLAAIDARHKLLPNLIVLPASLVVGVIVLVAAPSAFPAHLLAGIALGAFFFAFAALIPGSMGMGDAKLGFLVGIALGAQALGAVLIASAALLVAAMYILATRGLSARRDAIPFGPFLALGGILAFFLG